MESYAADALSQPINQVILDTYKDRLKTLQGNIRLEGTREAEDRYHVQLLAVCQFLESFRIEKRTFQDFIELFTVIFRYGLITYKSWDSFCVPDPVWDRLEEYRCRFFEQFQTFSNSKEIKSRKP